MARKWWKYLLDPTGFGEKVFNGWKNVFNGQGFLDSFYGDANSLGDIIDDFGDYSNALSGDYAMADYEDAIYDENATVAYNRQRELMALEAEYNSPVYKSNELAKAGLNPALASGVSNAVGGASAHMSQPHAGSGSLLNVIGAISNLSMLSEQKRGLKLDNDMKEQLLYEQSDSYPIRWLGMHADSTLKLTKAQRESDEAEMLRYELGWLRKTEEQRIAILESEKNKNEAIAKYNNKSADEKEKINTQLDNWIEKYMDAEQKANLEKKLAEAESIKDANARANAIFWAKVAALVAGGVCMFIPGAQGLGVGLMATSISWDAASQIGGAIGK